MQPDGVHSPTINSHFVRFCGHSPVINKLMAGKCTHAAIIHKLMAGIVPVHQLEYD
jgi:hypothetical protein